MVNSRISRDEVARVAELARLALDDAALDHFTGHLAGVLDHFADIEALDLTDVPPMTHPQSIVNVMRDDTVAGQLDRDAVLAEAPDADDGQFAVPPILGEAP